MAPVRNARRPNCHHASAETTCRGGQKAGSAKESLTRPRHPSARGPVPGTACPQSAGEMMPALENAQRLQAIQRRALKGRAIEYRMHQRDVVREAFHGLAIERRRQRTAFGDGTRRGGDTRRACARGRGNGSGIPGHGLMKVGHPRRHPARNNRRFFQRFRRSPGLTPRLFCE